MTRFPRVVAGLAACLSLALLTSACNTQPDAARVDGSAINQSALDAELSSLSANRAYIEAVDKASAQSGEQVAGAARGTYNSLWTAHVLTGAVTAAAVAHYLEVRGLAPDPSAISVAEAVEAADYGPYWAGFPASYRATLAERTADLARLGPPSLPASELASAYKQLAGYLYREVCVRAPVFAASGPGAAASATALRRARSYAALHSSASGPPAICYTPSQLVTQPAPFVSAVEGLAVGARGRVVPTSGGYEVVEVTRRVPLPLDPTLRATIEAVVATGSGAAFPRLDSVLAQAKVVIDPEYGTWQGSTAKGFQVAPPSTTSAS
ncbi:MAG: hypothetical protein M0T80_14050 [Actinomycetota bacterium]|nr:hypothetical protein [Actinomycetota bacterium]